jgi:hypothetical protein
MSSQSPLEVYESAMTNEKRPCRELASFEAQPPLSASLASCGYGIVSGRLRSNAENAYVNWFDPDHGLIICSENYKSRDRHTGAKMIWPSNVLWQTWKSTALEAGKRASDLRAIVRQTIINEESKIAIWQASKHSSFSRIENHDHVEYTSLDNGFYAILGTPTEPARCGCFMTTNRIESPHRREGSGFRERNP